MNVSRYFSDCLRVCPPGNVKFVGADVTCTMQRDNVVRLFWNPGNSRSDVGKDL